MLKRCLASINRGVGKPEVLERLYFVRSSILIGVKMQLNLMLLWITLAFVAVGAVMLFLQPAIDFHA